MPVLNSDARAFNSHEEPSKSQFLSCSLTCLGIPFLPEWWKYYPELTPPFPVHFVTLRLHKGAEETSGGGTIGLPVVPFSSVHYCQSKCGADTGKTWGREDRTGYLDCSCF